MSEYHYPYEMRCDFREAREHEFWLEAMIDCQNQKSKNEQTENNEPNENNDTQR